MCDYLERFLEEYYEFCSEDYNLLLYLLSLLPNSYQYQFVVNLVNHSHYLVKGDLECGRKTVGHIYYADNKIVLETNSCEGDVILLNLPCSWDI